MNKFDKLQIASIIQDIQSLYSGNPADNIQSTAQYAMAGAKKDGFDNGDLAKLVLDQSLDSDPKGITGKILNNVGIHYDNIKQAFKERGDESGLMALESMMTQNPDFQSLAISLSEWLQSQLKYQIGGTIEKFQGSGIIHRNGQTCNTKECAAFSNQYMRDNGYTIYGNAWNLKNADLLYSGYNTDDRPFFFNKEKVEQYNYDAADKFYKEFDSKSLDKSKMYAVNMFYKGSPKLRTAFRNGRDNIAGTHTGYLKYNNATNRWNVVHNIHGKLHVDDFINLQNSRGKYGVTAVFSPEPEKPGFLEKVKDFFFAKGGQISSDSKWYSVFVNDKEYKVILAKSESEKETGLQNVEELESNEGMLFDYVDDPQNELSFWMKDTTIPLDIVFINESMIVEDVKHGEPLSEEPLTCISDEAIVYVLEVSSGSGIKKGDHFGNLKKQNQENSEEAEGTLEIIGSDGEVQAVLQGSERIFSIKNTKTLVNMAKRAYESQSDSDYKALGRKVFEYMKIQNERDPEWVEQ